MYRNFWEKKIEKEMQCFIFIESHCLIAFVSNVIPISSSL